MNSSTTVIASLLALAQVKYGNADAGANRVFADAAALLEAPPSTLSDVLAEALNYEREAFENGDDPVDGGDIVEFFAAWRERLKASVAAPDLGARLLIRDLAALIDDAKLTHVYDLENGDEIPDDCPYTAASERAGAYLAAFPAVDAFQPAPIGAVEIIRDLRGALDGLDTQIGQMRGMFDDSDGTIQQAVDDGDEATERARLYLNAVEAGPLKLYVMVEGGNVQSVFCDRPVPGVEVTVIDYDVDDEDQAVVEIDQGGGRWSDARADVFEIAVEAAPVIRERQGVAQ